MSEEVTTENTEVKEEVAKNTTELKTLEQVAKEEGSELPTFDNKQEFLSHMAKEHFLGSQISTAIFDTLSNRGMKRVWKAIMSLPQEGLKVYLVGNQEKNAFLHAQKALMAKHALIFDSAKQDLDKARSETKGEGNESTTGNTVQGE